MSNLKLFIKFLVGAAVFIYLVSSFLIASFNIALWHDGHRFLSVVIYLMLVWSLLRAFAEPTKRPEFERESVLKQGGVEQSEPVTVGN
jgi:hypothetical protein